MHSFPVHKTSRFMSRRALLLSLSHSFCFYVLLSFVRFLLLVFTVINYVIISYLFAVFAFCRFTDKNQNGK